MFKEILRFELAYRLMRPATYIYAGILLLVCFGMFSIEDIAVGSAAGGLVHRNAPTILGSFAGVVCAFFMILTSALMSVPVQRDFEHQAHGLFFTKPITKSGYLGGRFLGSFIITFGVFLCIPLGFLLGEIIAPKMGWLTATKVGPLNAWTYIQMVFLIILPNLVFTGSLFFALATLTRNLLVTYVGNILLLVVYIWSANVLGNLDNRELGALLDPFALNTMSFSTQYWTAYDINTRLLDLSSVFILNRLLWLGVGGGLFALTFLRFRMTATMEGRRRKSASEGESNLDMAAELVRVKPTLSFGAWRQVQLFFSQSWYEFLTVVRERPFIAIAASGAIVMVAMSFTMGQLYGTTIYPVTYAVLGLTSGNFGLFQLIIIIFYTGELVWRDRQLRAAQLYDALPAPSWVYFASKFTGMMLVMASLQVLVLLVSLGIQLANGYVPPDPELYFYELFGLNLIGLAFSCLLGLFIQVLVNQKFLGYIIFVVYYIGRTVMGALDLNHNLYTPFGRPGYQYSDMNGYGHFLTGYFWFDLYWGFFALILAVTAHLFWVRGSEQNFAARLKHAGHRVNRFTMLTFALALVGFAATGGWIFYNTNVLNTYMTAKASEKMLVAYEQTYKKYEKMPQPRIVDAFLEVDIFPEKRDVYVRGRYVLKNKTGVPIDTLIIGLPNEVKATRMEPNRPFLAAMYDETQNIRFLKLETPLAPKDSLTLNWEVAYERNGFTNGMGSTDVVYNGTFFNSGLFPSLGYNAGGEMTDPDDRKKYDLPPRARMASIDDSTARMKNYISNDTDWMRFETIISTSADQIAIAPGYLQKEWTKGDRRYFHYKMDSPILGFYAFLSARYEVKRAKAGDVNIEIYYQKGHEYNLDKMIKGIQKSLAYYEKNFSPYQHRQMRIIEFPRYASFAQSFPNTVPYSESIGFIARLDDPEDIDYVFYVTAHEVGHQWWAHQVIGGNVQGATVMSETMSQYSALMVMEQEYGPAQMRKFLQHELDDYLQGRAFERERERPLLYCENQQYLHYNKGSIVMYALRDYLGEDSLNSALRKYVKAVAFQEPQYTNAREFLSYLRAGTPDSLKSILTDMFETITIFSNRVRTVEYEELPNKQYRVILEIEAEKFRADSIGQDRNISVNDWIDIGVFGEGKEKGKDKKEKALYLKKHRINQQRTTITVVVNEKPVEAGIDPYNKLIDRNSDDNRLKASLKRGK